MGGGYFYVSGTRYIERDLGRRINVRVSLTSIKIFIFCEFYNYLNKNDCTKLEVEKIRRLIVPE